MASISILCEVGDGSKSICQYDLPIRNGRHPGLVCELNIATFGIFGMGNISKSQIQVSGIVKSQVPVILLKPQVGTCS